MDGRVGQTVKFEERHFDINAHILIRTHIKQLRAKVPPQSQIPSRLTCYNYFPVASIRISIGGTVPISNGVWYILICILWLNFLYQFQLVEDSKQLARHVICMLLTASMNGYDSTKKRMGIHSSYFCELILQSNNGIPRCVEIQLVQMFF